MSKDNTNTDANEAAELARETTARAVTAVAIAREASATAATAVATAIVAAVENDEDALYVELIQLRDQLK